MTRKDGFGLWSGVGLVIANMIGAGVLLSAGFMVQTMSAGIILGAWVLGMGRTGDHAAMGTLRCLSSFPLGVLGMGVAASIALVF